MKQIFCSLESRKQKTEHLEGKRKKKQNQTDEPCGNALAF